MLYLDMSSKSVDPKKRALAQKLLFLGVVSLFFAGVIFTLTFYPVIKEEIVYRFRTSQDTVIVREPGEEYGPEAKILDPIDTDFGIVVPKIAANAPIIADVDPYNPEIYQRKLTQGVAHAAGTSLPGQGGHMFLFAHSAGNFYEANRYNAVFYLLTKLEQQDEIDIFYDGKKYAYEVTSKQIVDPDQVNLLQGGSPDSITLMTCWPAGTTLKRLIVKGQLVDSDKNSDL